MQKTELKNELFDLARRMAKDGYSFSPAVTAGLKELIASGVDRMSEQDLASESKVEEARQNIRVFVKQLVKEAIKSEPPRRSHYYGGGHEEVFGRDGKVAMEFDYMAPPPHSDKRIEARAFTTVRFTICPLWPFC